MMFCRYCYFRNIHIDISEGPGLSGSSNSIHKISISFWPKMFVVTCLTKTAGKLTQSTALASSFFHSLLICENENKQQWVQDMQEDRGKKRGARREVREQTFCPPCYKSNMHGVSACAAAEQSQILLIFPGPHLDWKLNQYIEASSLNEKRPCKILAVGVITPTTHSSAVEQHSPQLTVHSIGSWVSRQHCVMIHSGLQPVSITRKSSGPNNEKYEQTNNPCKSHLSHRVCLIIRKNFSSALFPSFLLPPSSLFLSYIPTYYFSNRNSSYSKIPKSTPTPSPMFNPSAFSYPFLIQYPKAITCCCQTKAQYEKEKKMRIEFSGNLKMPAEHRHPCILVRCRAPPNGHPGKGKKGEPEVLHCPRFP